MSDRTSPVRNDILVSGRLSDGMIEVKFTDIESPETLKDFNQFCREFTPQFATVLDLTSHLEKCYDKPPGWFIDCFINNAFMGALDTVSNKICGKCFSEWHDKQVSNKLAVQILIWAAFVSEKYNAKEEPEIYSEVE
jgi:hypothetical protein